MSYYCCFKNEIQNTQGNLMQGIQILNTIFKPAVLISTEKPTTERVLWNSNSLFIDMSLEDSSMSQLQNKDYDLPRRKE